MRSFVFHITHKCSDCNTYISQGISLKQDYLPKWPLGKVFTKHGSSRPVGETILAFKFLVSFSVILREISLE